MKRTFLLLALIAIIAGFGATKVTRYNENVFEGNSFCLVHNNLTVPKNVKENLNHGIYALKIDGRQAFIYEGSGLTELYNPITFKSKNGWVWGYKKTNNIIQLQHNSQEGNKDMLPPQLYIEYELAGNGGLNAMELAELFRKKNKNSKCSWIYL